MTTHDPAAPPSTALTPEQPVRVRLRTPGDLVASLPALLGYHARHSIVLVVLGGAPTVVHLTMRLDLPEDADEVTWRAVAECFAGGVSRTEAHHAMLVVLDGDADSTRALAGAVREALEPLGVELPDAIVVADGRYRSVTCSDDTCCPPGGRPVPGSSALAAAAVTQGRVIHADREEMAAQLAPPDPAGQRRAERVAALLLTTADHGSIGLEDDQVRDLLDRCCEQAGRAELRLVDAVRLALLVRVAELRDRAYRHMLDVGPQVHRQLWSSVCRQVPPTISAVPLAMAALASYLDGDGGMANVAIERACEVDDTHPSVTLVRDVVHAVIRPRDVRDALARSLPPPG